MKRFLQMATMLWAATTTLAAAQIQGLLPVELSDLGYLRVSGLDVRVGISDADATYHVGDQISLIEITPTAFVALAGDDADHQRLCVFPRVLDNGQGTAWITEQFDLIFGASAGSISGHIPLRPTEIMPVIFEEGGEYQVLCERFGRTFSLVIAKETPGITFYEDLPASITQRVRQRDMATKRLVPLEQWHQNETDLSALRLELLANLVGSPAAASNLIELASHEMSPASGAGATPEPVEREAEATRTRDPADGLRKFTHAAPEMLRIPKLSKIYPIRKKTSPPPASGTDTPPPPDPVVEIASQPPGISPSPPPAVSDESVELAAGPVAPELPGFVGPPPPQAAASEKPLILAAAEPAPTPQPLPPPAPPVTPEATMDLRPGPEAEPTQDTAPQPVESPGPRVPEPAPIQVAKVEPPPQILETTILPSDVPTRKPAPEPEPEATANTVAEAALKLLVLVVALTIVFFTTILLLAKFMNRSPKAERILTDEEAAALAPPPLPPEPEPEPLPSPPVEAVLPEAVEPEVTPPSSIRPVNDPSLGTFTGSLDGFSITELVQFINSSNETGTLFISEPESPNHASVVFEAGEIVHATCAGQTGENAIHDVIGLRHGFFVFQRQPGVADERTIHTPTMALLMSQSQSMDELPVA